MHRNRFPQTIKLGDRLAHEAERLRQNVRTVPVGKERESLLRKARQLETVSHIGPANAALNVTAPFGNVQIFSALPSRRAPLTNPLFQEAQRSKC
jgi:hypothetical protein